MNEIIPWDEWASYIKPVYFTNTIGRPARGINIMLRMFLLQAWFNLSDEAMEDAIYDSYAFRTFLNIDYITEQVPDATTLCKFRKLLVDNGIAKTFFESINCLLEEHGHIMRGGTIVDATIIEAPSSTKNRDKTRDPEMCQTKKGSQWHFGMKAHIGVDAGTGYVHSVTATAANEHDITQAEQLIRDDDEVVYGDSGYTGIENRDEIIDDPNKSTIEYRTNRRIGKIRSMPEGYAKEFELYLEKQKSSVRAKVEYIFLIMKQRFGYRKTVYRGINKNLHRIQVLLCSANLLMCAKSGGLRPI